ncbi:hypothetical protein ACWIGI_34395 [Nocardia sp. NPDC055321]
MVIDSAVGTVLSLGCTKVGENTCGTALRGVVLETGGSVGYVVEGTAIRKVDDPPLNSAESVVFSTAEIRTPFRVILKICGEAECAAVSTRVPGALHRVRGKPLG